MRNILGAVVAVALVACGHGESAQMSSPVRFQLAAPQVTVDSIFFEEASTLTLELDHPGVEIRYAIGKTEVTQEDNLYQGPIKLDNSQFLTARAFHSEFTPSEIVRTEVRKVQDFSDASVTLSHQPDPRYAGQGSAGLVDRVKGGANFGSGSWMGFQLEKLRITMTWDEVRKVNSVTLSSLRNHGSWIFLPSNIELSIPGVPIVATTYDPPSSREKAGAAFLTVMLPKEVDTERLELIISPLEAIPDWHDGRGTTPWLFIDEVIIN